MKSVSFKYCLKNADKTNELEGKGSYYVDRNALEFKEKNGTLVLVDIVNLSLTRENEDMILFLDFNGEESYIEMKKMNQKIIMPLEVKSKKVMKNKFFVNYVLPEENEFEFFIEWILGDD